MKTIILPGFSPHNKDWALDIARHLKLAKYDCFVHFWRHWERGGNLSLNYEIEQIIKLAGDGKVNFVSKSVGTRVTTFLIPRLSGQIVKIIFCGIPLRGFADATKAKFKETLSAFPHDKIVCFQNENDPFGSFERVYKFIKKVNSGIEVIEKPGSDHEYPYFDDFASFLKG